jgi:non-specific serine/threonine protein kinase/serine/threonine-protein kinase
VDDVRWQRVKDVFSAALERDAPLRAAFLDEACNGDTELRAEVDSLIAAHDTTDEGFIETPAAARALGLGTEPGPRPWIGRRVGDYRLVEEVGRGGMSEVYKAVRDDDEYHKEVAVKVLRRGYDTRSLLRRFKVETQILATLDHPNIARLLDAGSTEEGLPYLVMDYIQGRPIDEYCALHELTLKARIELFRALCGAVQYVHQHLMVHGDLKCTNVLVAEGGKVKLLDFGIARLLNPTPGPNLPDAKLTSFVALTPEYASPEQIRGGAITTASDVYSLGVVLYRMLTGVLPHRVRGDLSYELATQILERDAPPPSAAVAANGGAEFEGFARQLRGDLDNIVLMALEKDPARRYPSVEAFESDIRRHLEGFPVTARAAGYGYRALKFVGRHKAGIAAISLLVATLIGGIVSTSWQARVANVERERAERHFNEVRKLANVFMFDLHSAIADLPGSTPARQMLVDNSLKYLEALSAESGNEPSLQRELASAYEKVADLQGAYGMANLGDRPGAIRSYRKALAIRRQLSEADPKNIDLRRELLRNYGKLSENLSGQGDPQEALAMTRQAVRLSQELASRSDATLTDRRNLASALASLGWQLVNTDQIGDGLLFIRQAIALFETLHTENPNDFNITRMLGTTYGRIGNSLLENTDQYAEALQMNTRAYEIDRRMVEADPNNMLTRKLLAYSLIGMGDALVHLKRPQDALQKQIEAAKLLNGILDADPKNEEARYNVAYSLSEASATDILLGDLDTAERRLTRLLAVLSTSAGVTQTHMNFTKVVLGLAYYRLGQVSARRAVSPTSTRTQHRQYCQDARRWFELSRPLIAEADATAFWVYQTRGKIAQIARELQACPEGSGT